MKEGDARARRADIEGGVSLTQAGIIRRIMSLFSGPSAAETNGLMDDSPGCRGAFGEESLLLA